MFKNWKSIALILVGGVAGIVYLWYVQEREKEIRERLSSLDDDPDLS